MTLNKHKCVVIAGGGTGVNAYPPTIYVVDVESAVDFNNVLMP